jgi:hypothetical protein
MDSQLGSLPAGRAIPIRRHLTDFCGDESKSAGLT